MSGRRGGWAVLAAGVVLTLAGPAEATKFRKPFNANVNLGHGFDNNYGAGGCTDYNCGGKCYDTHGGSDYPMVTGTNIVAAANGTVTTVVQGCANTGYRGNPCGSYCGNYVKLSHADGTSTIYCHMKNGSIVVNQGQSVSCGQKLGQSASSGSSTGPHLHFGWKPGGVNTDPYSGGCSNGGGAWVSQGPYNGAPGTACETNCQCTPGQQQSQGCGKCGTKTRTCGGNCQWGGWSGCGGQGPCSPGQGQSQGCGNCGTQTRSCKSNCQWTGWTGCAGEGPCAPGSVEEEACCDCGARERTCGGDCGWGAWSECDGPDPEPSVVCSTGQLGVCDVGQVQCLTGCLACVDTTAPSEELCDGLDNDCDGPVDEEATELGGEGPPLGAEILDLSVPGALRVGERATVWVVVRNVGTETWPAGESWLAAVSDGGVCPLWDVESWAAHDVAATLGAAVAPGEQATLAFEVRMPEGAAATVSARFELAVRGESLVCPSPGFEVTTTRLAPAVASEVEIGVESAAEAGRAGSAARGPEPSVDAVGGGDVQSGAGFGPTVSAAVVETTSAVRGGGEGCGAGPSGPRWPWTWVFVAALWMAWSLTMKTFPRLLALMCLLVAVLQVGCASRADAACSDGCAVLTGCPDSDLGDLFGSAGDCVDGCKAEVQRLEEASSPCLDEYLNFVECVGSKVCPLPEGGCVDEINGMTSCYLGGG